MMFFDPEPDRGIPAGDHRARADRRNFRGNGQRGTSIMQLSRWLAAGSAVLMLAAMAALPQPAQAREIVGFSGAYAAGTVGVGRAGKQWSGTAMINGKYLRPAWTPPAEVKRDKPSLPNVIRGGSGNNPMGAAALTLSVGEYAIHGTNNPGSIRS